MGLTYQSTRGGEKEVTASMAILQGLAKDGGLFMPSCIPQLDVPLEKLASMTYQETAYEVMKLFLTDYTEKELKDCIARAYDSKFDTEEIAPLAKADGAYYLELYHGSTIAFKDMALSILPHLMTTAARKNHVDREIVILTATSGDTGKAPWPDLQMCQAHGSLYSIPRTESARSRSFRCAPRKGTTPLWWQSTAILMTLRPA